MDKSKRSSRMARRRAETIKRLEREGYEVVRDPEPISLVIGQAPYQPDLIAKKNGEFVVVEIKTTEQLKSTSASYDVAKQIAQMPNWRYELVVSNPRSPSEAKEPSFDTVAEKRLDDALELLRLEQIEAAILLGAAAIEGALKNLLDHEHIEIEPHFSGKRLAKVAYFNGLLDVSLYKKLETFWECRSIVAHGGREAKLSKQFVLNLINEFRQFS